ncbi:hypothetical protein GCL60_02355 [Silvanigrella paludirubra]|uniref:Uncharacterized protein n=1 Tax=Silvanigrella paludirubra TaxID=2499159 RepID=A0A6N6VXM6_9BACT|nr:ankyrin repeat domain-containing protein [Silvanigrella paludirubra]KAB8040789.1 hypothetical protein GCL60_02355 [Silvanigrella paludirubra]
MTLNQNKNVENWFTKYLSEIDSSEGYCINSGQILQNFFGIRDGYCAGLSLVWILCCLNEIGNLKNLNLHDAFYTKRKLKLKNDENQSSILNELSEDFKKNKVSLDWFFSSIEYIKDHYNSKSFIRFENLEHNQEILRFKKYIQNFDELTRESLIYNDVSVCNFTRDQSNNPLFDNISEIFKDYIKKNGDIDLKILVCSPQHAMALYIKPIIDTNQYAIIFYDPNTNSPPFKNRVKKNATDLINEIKAMISSCFYILTTKNTPIYFINLTNFNSDRFQKYKPSFIGFRKNQDINYVQNINKLLCYFGFNLCDYSFNYIISQKNIDLNYTDSERNFNILYYLIKKNIKDKLEILLRHPSLDVNFIYKNNDNISVFEFADRCAAFSKDYDILKLLLEHPKISNITKKNNYNRLTFYKNFKHNEIYPEEDAPFNGDIIKYTDYYFNNKKFKYSKNNKMDTNSFMKKELVYASEVEIVLSKNEIAFPIKNINYEITKANYLSEKSPVFQFANQSSSFSLIQKTKKEESNNIIIKKIDKNKKEIMPLSSKPETKKTNFTHIDSFRNLQADQKDPLSSLKNNDFQSTKKFIEDNENISMKDIDGNTLLHLAALSGNMEIIRSLIYKNPRLSTEKNKHGRTPKDLISFSFDKREIYNYLKKFEDACSKRIY